MKKLNIYLPDTRSLSIILSIVFSIALVSIITYLCYDISELPGFVCGGFALSYVFYRLIIINDKEYHTAFIHVVFAASIGLTLIRSVFNLDVDISLVKDNSFSVVTLLFLLSYGIQNILNFEYSEKSRILLTLESLVSIVLLNNYAHTNVIYITIYILALAFWYIFVTGTSNISKKEKGIAIFLAFLSVCALIFFHLGNFIFYLNKLRFFLLALVDDGNYFMISDSAYVDWILYFDGRTKVLLTIVLALLTSIVTILNSLNIENIFVYSLGLNIIASIFIADGQALFFMNAFMLIIVQLSNLIKEYKSKKILAE